MSNRWGRPSDVEADQRRQAFYNQTGVVLPAETPKEEEEEEVTFKPEEPTVVLPDGSQVKVSEYDPYVTERKKIEDEKIRTDGIRSYLEKQEINPGGGEQQQAEEEPFWQPITFGEEEMPSEAEIQAAGHVNQIGERVGAEIGSLKETLNTTVAAVKRMAEGLEGRFLRDDLSKVSAETGIPVQDLVEGNEETGIDDPYKVATYLAGKKAMEEDLKEKAQQADEERKRQMAGVGGTTSGGGGVDLGGKDERVVNPPKINYNDPVQVGQHFNFGKQEDI